MYVNRSYLCRPDRATARFHQASQPGRSLPFQPQDVHDQRQRVKDFLGRGGYLRGMSMELRHLRYFVAAVREGSMTRAAKKLNMAQPPLSRQIHQLEEELGVLLLERGSRPLPNMVRRFHATFPDLKVEMLELSSIQQVSALKEGQIDVGFGRLHVEDL